MLCEAGVRVGKVHLSAALRAEAGAEARGQLRAFVDPVYLPQVKARRADGRVISHADLPAALAAGDDPAEWRVHFHVPLFFERLGALRSTSPLLIGAFAEMLRSGAAEHLDIETYTFNVLPADLRPAALSESIAREYRWVVDRMFP